MLEVSTPSKAAELLLKKNYVHTGHMIMTSKDPNRVCEHVRAGERLLCDSYGVDDTKKCFTFMHQDDQGMFFITAICNRTQTGEAGVLMRTISPDGQSTCMFTYVPEFSARQERIKADGVVSMAHTPDEMSIEDPRQLMLLNMISAIEQETGYLLPE